MIIDAHLHLWDKQNGIVNGKPVYDIGGGRSDFGGEIRQMMPPYLYDGKNSVEALISNMNFACVSGCVVTQEYIDGNQDKYLLEAKSKYGDRIKICALYEENGVFDEEYFLSNPFDGLKICAGRLADQVLTKLLPIFKMVERSGRFISIDLSDGEAQVPAMKELIKACPNLRIAIGHFGMVTRDGWLEQIRLACNPNVYIESGGITWLFNDEFYPYPSAVDAIKEAASICGIEKLMWGSDYPRTMTIITYLMSLDFVIKSDKMTDEEKSLFLGENARKFYGFSDLPIPEKIHHMAE
ncbi:MAG: amidohydrolase [Oscillospiraceae bacterium]|nr:amidohydrolase [Oscillospiraceae bacterium]